MRAILPSLLLSFFVALPLYADNAASLPADGAQEMSTEPMQRNIPPLMERYLLDEMKDLRINQARMKAELQRDIVDRQLGFSEQVMSYSNNITTFFFYVFAIVGAALTIIGWRSFADLKNSVRGVADKEIHRLSQEYEDRLTALEEDLKEKGDIIIENQREIEKSQKIHALWLQANQTPDPRSKIAFFDQILEVEPQDYESLSYKADAALQLGDREWALSLCNRVLEENPDYAIALYFRACAHARLENPAGALADLENALTLSPGLVEQALAEEDFESLRPLDDFTELTTTGSLPLAE